MRTHRELAQRIEELSVIVPALEASRRIGPLLDGIVDLAGEVVVVDGDSQDQAMTAAVVQARGARFARAAQGRGTQIRAGCAIASGSWLLVLHADSVLPATWADAVQAFIGAPEHRGCAACFQLAFDDRSWPARRTAALANLRTRLLALPYGDQGLLISRELHDRIGGYRDLPIMEDVDIVRRISRRRLRMLDIAIRTSAERYRREGWMRRGLKNLSCLILWFAGVPAERIAARYARSSAARARKRSPPS